MIMHDLLRCPNCKSEHMHHVRVEIFERHEDEEDGVHAVVTQDGVTVDNKMKENPSDRRNGLLIFFRCERCSMDPVFAIVQHKGQTLTSWR